MSRIRPSRSVNQSYVMQRQRHTTYDLMRLKIFQNDVNFNQTLIRRSSSQGRLIAHWAMYEMMVVCLSATAISERTLDTEQCLWRMYDDTRAVPAPPSAVKMSCECPTRFVGILSTVGNNLIMIQTRKCIGPSQRQTVPHEVTCLRKSPTLLNKDQDSRRHPKAPPTPAYGSHRLAPEKCSRAQTHHIMTRAKPLSSTCVLCRKSLGTPSVNCSVATGGAS
eukprot:3155196-Pleurochrysis_carterae.AAC.2